LWLQHWRLELADGGTFSRLKGPLKLPTQSTRASDLVRPSDVEDSKAEDRGFGGRLRNLGVAVGVNL
jgi:hypothetical protein